MRMRDLILALHHCVLSRLGISDQSRRLAQYHRARALPPWGLSLAGFGDLDNKVDVSIIIPSFNYAEHLPAAIGSAIEAATSNTHLRAEVIVFDDRSTDDSYDVAMRLGRRCGIPFLVIRPLWNVGLVYARNTGLRHAKGKYCFFLDADNTMCAAGLKSLHAEAEKQQADASYGPIRTRTIEGAAVGFLSNQPFDVEILLKEGNYIDAMALFRRSSLLAMGGFDLELLRLIGGHEDHDVWLRLAAAGARVCFREDALVGDYLLKPDSMVNCISPREYANAFRYMGAEIFVGPDRRDNNLIFDLGFDRGENALRYLDAGYKVIAVEADPRKYANATVQFAQCIKEGRLTLIHAAVVGWRGMQLASTFQFCSGRVDSSRCAASSDWQALDESPCDELHAIPCEVPATCLERLVAEYGCPLLLKINFAGLAREVVNDLERLTILPAYLGWRTTKQYLLAGMMAHLRLRRLGYCRFRITPHPNFWPEFEGRGSWVGSPQEPRRHSNSRLEQRSKPWRGAMSVMLSYVVLYAGDRLTRPGSPGWRAGRHASSVINAVLRKLGLAAAERSTPRSVGVGSHAALTPSACPSAVER